MDPNQQGNPFGDPNLDKNPFEGILAQIQSRGVGAGTGQPPDAMMQGASPEGMHPMPGGQMMPNSQMPGMMGGQGKPPPNQLIPGQEGGTGKFLLSTMQQLQSYITAEDDSNNIMIARSIIGLITKLLEREQQEQTAKIPQDQQMLEALQPPAEGQQQEQPQGPPPQAGV